MPRRWEASLRGKDFTANGKTAEYGNSCSKFILIDTMSRAKDPNLPLHLSQNLEDRSRQRDIGIEDGCPKTPVGCWNNCQVNNQTNQSDAPESATVLCQLAGASSLLLLAKPLPLGGSRDDHIQDGSLWMSLFLFLLDFGGFVKVSYHRSPTENGSPANNFRYITGNTASNLVNSINDSMRRNEN